MKTLIFVLFSSVCLGQSDQYKQILISKKLGKEISCYTKGYGIMVNSGGKRSAIVDSLGKITFEYPYKSEIIRLSSNRFILKDKQGRFNGKTTLIDPKGNQLIPFENFKYRTWERKNRLIYSKAGKDCVYDYDGNLLIPFYDKIEFASENRFFVKKEKGWFIYDFDGRLVSDREFEENMHFYRGRTYLGKGNYQGEIIDNNGKVVNTISNHYIDNINSYPYLITKNPTHNHYGIIDANENKIVDEIYDQALVGREYIYLLKEDKVSIFSKEEKKVFPTNFYYVNHLFNGIFKTIKDYNNPKIAVIRLNGDIIFPKEYDIVEAVKVLGEDFIYLSKNGEEKIVNRDLQNILEEGYEVKRIFSDTFILKKNEIFYKFSVKDRKYEELPDIISIKESDYLYYPKDNFPAAIVCKNKNNLYGVLNSNGKEIIPFIYDKIFEFFPANEIIVQKGNKYGSINFDNEPLTDIIYDKYSSDNKKLKLTQAKNSEYVEFTFSGNRIF
ncbi:WG repeat-containing protein [Chryseobacterium nematophagum]|uniref:WG repeat-containing protein n=1 Tax=Chryseobacterium nematophagum TaxID=2305228 RepID=A0A3M7TBV8_9FLAO|nr:WG repeat-containing protein [Chryseobacterium nematophagum]RNA61012.1 WG repeat-containing protein [Chryseobacterium nematophagum]